MKVTVHYLLSKNNKIGSKLISWVSKHLTKITNTPSHIALLVNNRWVHESTMLSGVRVISYEKWLEINEEVDKIPCIQEYREYDEIKEVYRTMRDRKYDFFGALYLGIKVLSNKLFKTTIPNKNKWEKENKYFCCEAVEKIAGLSDSSMKVPVQLMDELNGNN